MFLYYQWACVVSLFQMLRNIKNKKGFANSDQPHETRAFINKNTQHADHISSLSKNIIEYSIYNDYLKDFSYYKEKPMKSEIILREPDTKIRRKRYEIVPFSVYKQNNIYNSNMYY